MTVRFRLMTIEDIPDAMRLKDVAGWNQTVVDWERFLYANPEGCFAAEYDGRVVGTSATIIYEGRLAWIGMVLVDSKHRGQGIGTALLERAIGHLDTRRVPCVKLDATPQGKPLYEKFGFLSEHHIERWMLKHQPDGNPILKTSVQIEQVLRVDREIFGADRSGLLRSLAEEAPELALVAEHGARVAGYTFGRHGSLADQLGPWAALNEDTAATLLDEFVRRSGKELIFVDCVGPNPLAVSLVKERGFEFSRPLTRMFRGANSCAGRPALLCATLGPEFG